MAGHLSRHPYYKSFDELQRTEKRMQTYLDMNWELLSDDEKESIQILIEATSKALRQIPENYHITKHFQKKSV